jgi:prepilin-type N-terminal cleavage/methylation domain-containing protein
MKYKHYNNTRGFTLVEILVCIFIFTLISLSVYRSIASIYQVHETTDAKVVATQLAGEQIEIIRNFPYSSVGIKSGLPVGVIDHIQSISRSGFNFEVTTTVRNIDDPFDGVFPTDTVPADYKLVQMDIDCLNCKNFSQLTFTTTVGPKALETPSTSGALFIQAIDASGLPVSQADVHIVNSSISPAITK